MYGNSNCVSLLESVMLSALLFSDSTFMAKLSIDAQKRFMEAFTWTPRISIETMQQLAHLAVNDTLPPSAVSYLLGILEYRYIAITSVYR